MTLREPPHGIILVSAAANEESGCDYLTERCIVTQFRNGAMHTRISRAGATSPAVAREAAGTLCRLLVLHVPARAQLALFCFQNPGMWQLNA